MKKFFDTSLYLIADSISTKNIPIQKLVKESVKGGCTMIQLREKTLNQNHFIDLAKKFKNECDKYNIPLIINDNFEVMKASNADGIHVGQNDETLSMIKKKISPSKIIGITVNSTEQALKAVEQGADYLGTDSVFESSTKPGKSMGLQKLKDITNISSVPVVGIGGINKDNISSILHSNVKGIAVSSAILNSNSYLKESESLSIKINQFKENQLKLKIAMTFEKIKEKSPLVHNITNNVVMNQTANGCIHLGASPIMSEAIEEMEDLVSISNALNVNIGTLTTSQINSILFAGRKANQCNIPITLDPVGVGASNFRRQMSGKLLNELQFSIIKGNQSEISFLHNENQKQQKGVDSIGDIKEIDNIVKELSRRLNGTIVAATGKIDAISDGNETYQILNENDMLGKITGTGCLSGALISCFSGVTNDHLVSAIGGLASILISAEKSKFEGSYSFKVSLMDNLSNLNSHDFIEFLKIKKKNF
eukprot:gene1918-1058_t